MDFTDELYQFSFKNNIKLIGDYTNVKNNTPIFFSCSGCNVQIKKSFKILTKYKNSHVSIWSRFCDKCFRNIHH
jgi:hypothetical protein